MTTEAQADTGTEHAASAAGSETLLTTAAPAAETNKSKPGAADAEPADKDDKGDKGGANGSAAAAHSPAAPESYELAAPEGWPAQPETLQNLTVLCREHHLSKAQAEAVMGYMAGNYSAWQEQQVQTRKDWLTDFKADKEFGGDKFEVSVAEARKALAAFDSEGEVSSMLRESGYGDNPHVLRIFARVGRALAEDKLVGGSGGSVEKPLEERFYPDM